MSKQSVMSMSVREFYAYEYQVTRRLFEGWWQYEGFAEAMNNLWDNYAAVTQGAVQTTDLKQAWMLYARAAALWSLYVRNCVQGGHYDFEFGIPF